MILFIAAIERLGDHSPLFIAFHDSLSTTVFFTRESQVCKKLRTFSLEGIWMVSGKSRELLWDNSMCSFA